MWGWGARAVWRAHMRAHVFTNTLRSKILMKSEQLYLSGNKRHTFENSAYKINKLCMIQCVMIQCVRDWFSWKRHPQEKNSWKIYSYKLQYCVENAKTWQMFYMLGYWIGNQRIDKRYRKREISKIIGKSQRRCIPSSRLRLHGFPKSYKELGKKSMNLEHLEEYIE